MVLLEQVERTAAGGTHMDPDPSAGGNEWRIGITASDRTKHTGLILLGVPYYTVGANESQGPTSARIRENAISRECKLSVLASTHISPFSKRSVTVVGYFSYAYGG